MAHLFVIAAAARGATSAVDLAGAPGGESIAPPPGSALPWISALSWSSEQELATTWEAVALERDCYALAANGSCLRPVPCAHTTASGNSAPPFLLVRSCDEDERERWILLGPPGNVLRINGSPLALGARVLRHRDELRVAGMPGRAFFSLEALCRVAPFEGPEGARCPRCQLDIAIGTPAVRCAQCNTSYHQSDERPCWTYAQRCALDDQPTSLDAGYRFRPEEVMGG